MKTALLTILILTSLANPAEGHRQIVNTQNVAGAVPAGVEAELLGGKVVPEVRVAAPATYRAEGAAVAQSPSWTKVEHRPIKAEGVGSNPTSGPSSAPCTGWFSYVRPSMGLARVRHRVEHLIACAVRIWPVAGGVYYAQAISLRESGDWPWSVNESSGCAGLFQHVASLWPGRVRFWLHRDWFSRWAWDRGISPLNARANVLVSVQMAHSGGWGPWGG